jgi:hypothetical protein
MLPSRNPYRPGAGLDPPELAGREEQRAYLRGLADRAEARTVDRGMVMTGLRGVGKTALLNRLAADCEDRGWICATVEGQGGPAGADAVRKSIGSALLGGLARFSARHRLSTGLEALGRLVGGFSLAAGPVTVTRQPALAATGVLEVDLEQLAVEVSRAAQQHQAAFGVFVDEIQDLQPNLLAALIVAQHRCQQIGLPFYVVGAGLPSSPAVLAAAKSYSERLFHYSVVGPLNASEAAAALAVPAQREGCSYEKLALAHLVSASQGYPFFLQTFGKQIWDIAEDDVFTLAEAKQARQLGMASLDSGFFPGRWDRASNKERRYMAAMAAAGTATVPTSAVAALLSTPPARLSRVRDRLIAKGLIYAPRRGEVTFAVPGMADYIARATTDMDDLPPVPEQVSARAPAAPARSADPAPSERAARGR